MTLPHGSVDHVLLWNLRAGDLVRSLIHTPGMQGPICSLSYTREGKILAAGTYWQTIRLSESPSGKLHRDLTFANEITAVAFAPDGNDRAHSLLPVWAKKPFTRKDRAMVRFLAKVLFVQPSRPA